MSTSPHGSELMTALQADLRKLLDEEAFRIRPELAAGFHRTGRSGLLFAAAAVLGAAACGTALAAAVRGLDTVVPRPVSARLVTSLLAVGATGAAVGGVNQWRRSREELSSRLR